MSSTKVTIPKTTYTVGDTLRVTVELWGKRAATHAFQLTLPCDPKGRVKNTLPNTEEWDVGTAGRDIDQTTDSGVTIATAQVPIKADV